MSFKRVLNVVETHDGEPMRVVTGGVPNIPGKTVYEKEEYLRLHDDSLRKFLLREPRGYPPLCCNVLVPPADPEQAAAGFIIMEQNEAPGYNRSFRSACTEAGFTPKVIRRTRRMESLIMYAANDVGVGWSDMDVSIPKFSRATPVPVADVPSVDMVAVWHRGHRSKLLGEVAEMIADYAKKSGE